MKLWHFPMLLFAALIITSCDGKKLTFGSKKAPSCYFDDEFRNFRWIDLSKKIDDSIEIERNGEAKTLSFEYDRKTKENIIRDSDGNILATGKVTKYQDVYFINIKSDSVYQLASFVYNKGETISGITEFDHQQISLHKMVSTGHDDGLIMSQIDKDFLLETDKKKLLKLYSSILLECPPWSIK